jgi:hypothetical protein
MVIVESATAEKRTPTITIKSNKGEEKRYLLPTGAHVMVQNGNEVYPDDILAKIPRATTKTKDITGDCRASSSCSKLVTRGTRLSFQRSRERCIAVRWSRACAAASFHQTTRVLVEAFIAGRFDHLRGLKENVRSAASSRRHRNLEAGRATFGDRRRSSLCV